MKDILKLIEKGKILNLGKLVAINFFIAENDGGPHNVGMAPIYDEWGNLVRDRDADPVLVFVQIDRGQSSNPKQYFPNGKNNSRVGIASSKDVEEAPYLSGDVDGFYPNFWFDRIRDSVTRYSHVWLVDEKLSSQPIFRKEFNSTEFEIALLTDAQISKIVSCIAGNHPIGEEYVEFYKKQRDFAINSALLAKNLYDFTSFLASPLERNFNSYQTKLQTFRYGGTLLFPSLRQPKLSLAERIGNLCSCHTPVDTMLAAKERFKFIKKPNFQQELYRALNSSPIHVGLVAAQIDERSKPSNSTELQPARLALVA